MLDFLAGHMLELFECLFDVTWHGKMDLSFVIVPVQCDAYITCASPVCSDLVVDFEGFLQVECVFFSNILDTEIVDY